MLALAAALRPSRRFGRLAIAYIDVFRSIPLLVLLVVIYYALPFVGIRLSPFGGRGLRAQPRFGAYSAEIFRAGIEAVPKGQFEAGPRAGPESWRLDGRRCPAAGI